MNHYTVSFLKNSTLSFLFLVLLLVKPFISLSCTGGTNAGGLNPTLAYQTQNVSNGQYYVVNVTCGYTYNFTFCSNGGAAAWDTQITINQTNNTTQLAYNDDACGLQSNVSWTATFNGTIHVLISLYSCNNSGGSAGVLAYNATPTSVTYSSSCTTANPIITGNSAGSFAFNPIPGDGAVINSSTGAISNGTSGSSYTVDYTYCGGTIQIPLTLSSPPCYNLNGTAQYINVGGENCIQLTQEINNQTGCAWNENPIDFTSDFSLTLDYYFGNNINGADGNTFTFQPSSSSACGQNGGQLGAGGIANALVVEFDTYDNDNPTHLYDMSCDHIAVEIDGNMLGPGAPYCGPVCAKAGGGNIDDGGVYEVEIAWDASSQQLSIYFNGALRLTCNGDFVNTVFGGQSSVYWGATSATGGLNNMQYFCPNTVVILPTELINLQAQCTNDLVDIHWQTASERDLDYFIIESTSDGIIYHPAGTVQATGNSQVTQNYSFALNSDQLDQYIRIKAIDKDGAFEASDIFTFNCGSFGNLFGYQLKADDLHLSFTENSRMRMVNAQGQDILNMEVSTESIIVPVNKLASGLYLLYVEGNSGRREHAKLFIP